MDGESGDDDEDDSISHLTLNISVYYTEKYKIAKNSKILLYLA